MRLDKKLNSFHLVERESKLSLIRWTYPTVDDEIRGLILSKCFCTFKSEIFYSIRAKSLWIYIYQGKQDQNISKAVVVTTRDYDPEKYKPLCSAFYRMYNKTGNPVDLVKLYLNLIISGSCSFQENGAVVSYSLNSFESEKHIRELINLLGPEIVFLYNAILLKKRILLYHQSIENLQLALFSVISLVTLRNENEYLLPFIEDVKQLKGISFYMAGTINKDFIQQSDLYDVFVDLVTPEITISAKAKESLMLTKIHKDLAYFMVDASKKETNEQEIISEISARTREVLKRLNAMATIGGQNETKMITVDDLRSKNLSPQTENFLFQLAVAENMMML